MSEKKLKIEIIIPIVFLVVISIVIFIALKLQVDNYSSQAEEMKNELDLAAKSEDEKLTADHQQSFEVKPQEQNQNNSDSVSSLANTIYIQENAGRLNKSIEHGTCNKLTISISAHKKKTVKELGELGFDCGVLTEGVYCTKRLVY